MVDSNQRACFLQIPLLWVHDAWIARMLALYSKLDFIDESLIRYRTHASQQIGLLPISVKEKLELLRRTAASDLMKEADQFEELYKRLRNQDDVTAAALLPQILEKIQHDRICAGLPAARLTRLWSIANRWKDYHKFSFGLRSMARDILL